MNKNVTKGNQVGQAPVAEWQTMSVGRSTYNNLSQVIVKAGRGGVEGGARAAGSINEAIFPDLVNTQVDKYQEFIGGADVLVPEKVVERPRRRLKAMEQLRKELLQATNEANDKVVEIFQTIQANKYCPQTDEGFLEIDFAEYEDCFFIDVT